MPTLKITECTSADELFCQYDKQFEPQRCYIELGLEDGVLLAGYNAIIGSGVPATVYHNIDRRYSIPILTGDAANRVLHLIAPLADRILADSEVEWDGNNHVGVLGEDGQAAEDELEAFLGLSGPGWDSAYQGFDETDLIAVWDIDSATNGEEIKEYGITAETTDQRLDEIAIEIAENLVDISPSGVAVVPGLHAYLRGLRDDLERESKDD